jgi:enoyl-CoA hydratase/carnithine racemase
MSGQSGNRIDEALARALLEALPAPSRAAGRCKAIVFAALGPDFSVGMGKPDARAVTAFHQLLYRLVELAVPTVAEVHGQCLGAGLELAAFCNFLFADRTARFGQAPGKPPMPSPSSMILPLKLGPARALDLVLGEAKLDAAEAYRRGLVTAWTSSPLDLPLLVASWIENHLLPKSASSLLRANRLARLSFNAQLRAELPALERFYLTKLAGPDGAAPSAANTASAAA